jgi:cytochrome P450
MTTTQERLDRMARPPGRRHPPVDRVLLPAGPRWPVLAQSIGLLRFRHRFVPAMSRRYGDPFTITVLPGGRHIVVFHRPEHVQEIFAADPGTFHAGKGNAILGPVMGEHSLLLVDAAEHARARRMLMPAFTARAIKGYRDVVARLAAAEVERWQTEAPFASLERMNALTLEVILQVVFGVTDEDRLAELRPLVRATVEVSPAVFLGYRIAPLRRLGPWRRAIENQVQLDRVIHAEIAARRTEDLSGRDDVLSRLLQVRDEETGSALTDDELRDQLVTLLLAGHETTATALAWTLHELARDPVQERRARDAVDRDDDEYLEAVLKESLRLHPVIPMVVRELEAPATVGGVPLPAGAHVAASILLAHADEAQVPDHAAFRPERFLAGEVHPHTWIPFGGGVRRCIGAGFSLMEGVVVLREVLTRYDVSLPPGETEQPKVRNITSVPRNGARIVLRQR